MNMMWYAINFLVCIAEAWIAVSYFGSISDRKETRITVFVGKLTLLYGTLFIVNVARIPTINLLVATTITYTCALLLFQGTWQRKIYYTFIWVICSAGAEVIMIYALSALTVHQPSGLLNANIITYFGMILSKLLLFVLLRLVVKFLVKDRPEIGTKQLFSYLLLPCFSLLLMLETFYFTMDILLDDYRKALLFVSAMGIVYVNILVFDIFEKALRTEIQDKENALMQQRMEMAEQYTKLIEARYDAKRLVVHDTKQHLEVIKGLSLEEDRQQMIAYIMDYCGGFAKNNLTPITGHKVFDILLNTKHAKAEELGIDFELDYQPVDLTFIEDVDLCVILGNVLDNALESCQKSEKKWIKLKIGKRNENRNTIMVYNACSKAPKVRGISFLTSKTTEDHGLGLKSIKIAVEEYEGQVEFTYLPEEAAFKTLIILPSKTSREAITLAKETKSADF